jgi:hypothetical protein
MHIARALDRAHGECAKAASARAVRVTNRVTSRCRFHQRVAEWAPRRWPCNLPPSLTGDGLVQPESRIGGRDTGLSEFGFSVGFRQASPNVVDQASGEPNTGVRFVVPPKYIIFVNLAVCMNSKGELIATAVVGEKKQTVERHVQLSEISVRTKRQIFGFDLGHRPNDAGAVVANRTVGFFEKLTKRLRYSDSELGLRSSQALLVGTSAKLCVVRATFDFFFERLQGWSVFCPTILIIHVDRARTEFRMQMNAPKMDGYLRCAVAAGWAASSRCALRNVDRHQWGLIML